MKSGMTQTARTRAHSGREKSARCVSLVPSVALCPLRTPWAVRNPRPERYRVLQLPVLCLASHYFAFALLVFCFDIHQLYSFL